MKKNLCTWGQVNRSSTTTTDNNNNKNDDDNNNNIIIITIENSRSGRGDRILSEYALDIFLAGHGKASEEKGSRQFLWKSS